MKPCPIPVKQPNCTMNQVIRYLAAEYAHARKSEREFRTQAHHSTDPNHVASWLEAANDWETDSSLLRLLIEQIYSGRATLFLIGTKENTP